MSPGDYLATRYDERGGRATPVELSTGSDPVLRLVDGFTRGRRMLGRFTTSPAALGLIVEPAADPLRLTIQFLLDKITPEWWAEQGHPAGSALLPRVLLIRAQRRLRGAVVLRSHPEHRPVRGEFSFELAPAEIPDGGGLVLLELWGYREWPAAAARPARADLAPGGVAGVGITTLTVRPAEPGPRRSSGRPRVAAAATGEPLVVNPASGPTRVTLIPVEPRRETGDAAGTAAPPRPTTQGTRRAVRRARRTARKARRAVRRARRTAGRLVRLASRAVHGGARRLRRLAMPVMPPIPPVPPVRAMNVVDGAAVEVDLRPGGDRREITITVPASPHPVLVWLDTEQR